MLLTLLQNSVTFRGVVVEPWWSSPLLQLGQIALILLTVAVAARAPRWRAPSLLLLSVQASLLSWLLWL